MPPSDIDLNADCGESLSAWAMAGDEAVLLQPLRFAPPSVVTKRYGL